MRKKLHAFLHDDEGLTMVEYAVAGSLIAAASVAAFTNLGQAVHDKIVALTNAITGGYVLRLRRQDMFDRLRAFLCDEEGLTMVEYAVAGSLITAAAVAAFTDLGTAVANKIQNIANAITGG
jgi:pilus assembly protein Flp/PilA